MKTIAVFVLVVLLTGCSASGNGATQLAALQKQVDTLSAKVNKIEVAKTAMADYDLQSRCAAAAKRRFDDLEATGGTTGVDLHVLTYEGFVSNYNKQLGHCFMAYSVTATADPRFDGIALVDAIQGMQYGYYARRGSTMITCSVTQHGGRQHCASEQQFREYLKNYMGMVELNLPAPPRLPLPSPSP